ncbi:hypothetical protein ABPG72_010875 [Tetrahymena utriculariae]
MVDLGGLIGSLNNLQKLNVSLWDNRISPYSFSYLAQGISQDGINLSDLIFNFDWNKFGNIGANHLTSQLKNLINLKTYISALCLVKLTIQEYKKSLKN